MREQEADEEHGQRPIYRDVWDRFGSLTVASVLAVRIEHRSRGRDGACTASNATLASELGVTERAITNAVKQLRAAGMLGEAPTARCTRRWLIRPVAAPAAAPRTEASGVTEGSGVEPVPPTDGSGVPPHGYSGVHDSDPRTTTSRPPNHHVTTPEPPFG